MSMGYFDNSVEITIRHRCSPVNLLHIQAHKDDRSSEGRGTKSLQKSFGHKWLTE